MLDVRSIHLTSVKTALALILAAGLLDVATTYIGFSIGITEWSRGIVQLNASFLYVPYWMLLVYLVTG